MTLLGLEGGTVTDIGLDLNPKTLEIRGRVELVAYPERLFASLSEEQKAASSAFAKEGKKHQELIRRMIEERGLRAQLRSGSLLTGQLYVAFEYFPEIAAGEDELAGRPGRAAGDAEHTAATRTASHQHLGQDRRHAAGAGGGELKNSLATLNVLLGNADRAVQRIDTDVTPELKKTLEELRRATSSANQLVKNADATLVGPDAPGQQDLRETMREVTRAARSLRELTDYLERHPEALLRGKN